MDRAPQVNSETIHALIGRAVMDKGFRDLLFTDPNRALEGYTLTRGELRLLRSFNRAAFEELARDLAGQLSRREGGKQKSSQHNVITEAEQPKEQPRHGE